MNLKDKIYGALFGTAIGDALGLGSEFMTRDEMKLYYPEGLRHYRQIIRDAHRSQWDPGDWSNDTELIVRLVNTVIENKEVSPKAFARSLKEWYDNDPSDVPSCMRWVISHPEWLENPPAVADRVWKEINLFEASNEATSRGVIPAIISENPFRDTKRIVLMTHPDTRCIVSAILIAKMAQSLMWEDKPASFDEMHELCHNIDSRAIPYLEHAYENDPEALEIDDPDTLWYTRKTMAISLWSVWHCSSAEEALFKVIEFAGDADTNASCAMALNGIKYGFDALPSDLIEDLVQKERLERVAEKFTNVVKEVKGIS